MARKIIAIILYIIAGFFLLIASIGAFFRDPLLSTKFLLFMVGIAVILGFIPLVIGAIFSGRKSWKHHVGILLITITGIGLFSTLSTFCFYMTPVFKAVLPDADLYSQYNYLLGFGYTIVQGTIGLLLIKLSAKKI